MAKGRWLNAKSPGWRLSNESWRLNFDEHFLALLRITSCVHDEAVVRPSKRGKPVFPAATDPEFCYESDRNCPPGFCHISGAQDADLPHHVRDRVGDFFGH